MKNYRLLLIVLMVFALAFGVQAQKLEFSNLGVAGGVIFPQDEWDTGFRIGVNSNLGELTDDLYLVPLAAYWSSGYTFGTFDLSLSNIQVGADVHYMIKNVKGLYAGGGLSLNFLSVDFPNLFGQGTSSSSDTKIGIHLLSGYNVPIGNLDGFAEAKYNLVSDFNTFELTVGVYFDMGK